MTRSFARVLSLLSFTALGLLAGPRSSEAQGVTVAARGPRFLMPPAMIGAAPVEVDASRIAILRRKISLELDHVRLGDALDAVARAANVRFVYVRSVLPVDSLVHFRSDSITVAAALTEFLLGRHVDVLVSGGNQIALVRSTTPHAAPGTVSGRVTDAKTGDALIGAEVWLEGTRYRTTTGDKGFYRLAEVAAGGYTLSIRRVGYARQSRGITVTGDQEITVDIALQPVVTQLNEIVTTVTGEQRLRELGHVVGRINADSLVKEAPISNLSELLTGRVPGLQVFQSQGTVGGEVHLQSRGPNSYLLNTEPIIVVDGMRYTSAVSGPGGLTEYTSRLNDISQNDIESVEIVKGPSAATLYGTDAANGVIVITTKRGHAGPPRWAGYARGTRTSIPGHKYPDMWWGWNDDFGIYSSRVSCAITYVAAGYCTQDSITVLPNPLNDPKSSVFGSQPRWEYGANVSGGRQDLRYYFAADLENATGPVRMPPEIAEQLKAQRGLSELPDEFRRPNTFDRLNLRANVTTAFGDAFELRLNSGYGHNDTRTLALVFGSPYTYGSVSGTPSRPYGTAASPDEAFTQTWTEGTDRFVGSVGAQWRLAPWLLTRGTLGVDLANTNRYDLTKPGEQPSGNFPDGLVIDDRVRQLSTTAELAATATARFGRVSLRTSVGGQYVRNLSNMVELFGMGLPPGGTSVNEAANLTPSQTYQETATLGSYLEETVGFNDRLFLTGAVRADGASTFGQNYDAAFYPKLSASWIVSEEPFFPRLPGVDELRFRYAFGASGEQPLAAWARPKFALSPSKVDGRDLTAIGVDGLGNPNLRPQRVREHEAGLDLSVLQNRFQLGLTWYRRKTMGQIVPSTLPLGFGSIYTNLGLTTQHGFEAELGIRVVDTRPVSVDVRLQHALHRTKLVDIGGANQFRWPTGGYVEGYPLGARFTVDPTYADANGDGILTSSEMQFDFSNGWLYMGESTPPIQQALSMVVGLFDRKLRVSALVQRAKGFTQVNSMLADQCGGSRCRAAVDPTSSLADQAEVLLVRAFGYGHAEPGDYTRLRELTLGLDLPSSVARALRMRSVSLALSGRNVALWTDFSGADPESSDVTRSQGGTADGIPQGRSWSLRVDLGL